jgi:hypothetical protein
MYLTDYVMDSYYPLQVILERAYSKNDAEISTSNRTWLRYHGCSLYSAGAMLATNHPCPSDEKVDAMEAACGRGVYTSRDFREAVSHSTPHRLPGSSLHTHTSGDAPRHPG